LPARKGGGGGEGGIKLFCFKRQHKLIDTQNDQHYALIPELLSNLKSVP